MGNGGRSGNKKERELNPALFFILENVPRLISRFLSPASGGEVTNLQKNEKPFHTFRHLPVSLHTECEE